MNKDETGPVQMGRRQRGAKFVDDDTTAVKSSPSAAFQANAKRRVSLAQSLGTQLKFMTPAQQQQILQQEQQQTSGGKPQLHSATSTSTSFSSFPSGEAGGAKPAECAALQAGIRVGVSLRAREYIAVGFYEAAIAACIRDNDMTSWSVALSLCGEPHKAADILEAFIIAACLVTYQHRKKGLTNGVVFDYKQVLASIIASPGAPATADIMQSLPPPTDQDYHDTVMDLCEAVSWHELHLWYTVAVILHPAYEPPSNPWLRQFFCLISPPEVINPDAESAGGNSALQTRAEVASQQQNKKSGKKGNKNDNKPPVASISDVTGSTRRLTRTDVENILISQATDTEVLIINAMVSWVLGRYRSAIRSATAALQVDPDDIQMRFLRCCCALQVGDRKLVGEDSTSLRQSESLFVATIGCALATYGIPQVSAKSAVLEFKSSVQFSEELYTHALCEWGHAVTLLQLGEFEAAREVAEHAVRTAPKRNLREWLTDVLVTCCVALEDSAYLIRLDIGAIENVPDGLTARQQLYLALVPCFGGGYALDSINKLLIDSDVGELLNPANVTNYTDVRHMLPIHMTTARSLFSYGRFREAWKEVKAAVACCEEFLGSTTYAMSDCSPQRVLFFGCTVGVALLDRMIEEDPLNGEETQDPVILRKRKEDDTFGDEIIATCRVWARLIRDFHPFLVMGHAAVCQVSIASYDLDSIERAVAVANMFPTSIMAQNCLSYALFSKHLIPEADAQAQKTLQRFPHVPEVDAMANLIRKTATALDDSRSTATVTYKYLYRGVLPFTYGPGDTRNTNLRQLFALFITFVNFCMQIFTVLCNFLPRDWTAYVLDDSTISNFQVPSDIPFFISAGYLFYVILATFLTPNMISVLLDDLKFRQTRLNRFMFSSRAFGLLNIANVCLMYLNNNHLTLDSTWYMVLLFVGLALLYFPYSTRNFFMRSIDEPSMSLPFWFILLAADMILYIILAPLHVINAAMEPFFFFGFTLLCFTPKARPSFDTPFILERLKQHDKALHSNAPHRYRSTSGSNYIYMLTTRGLFNKTHSSMKTEFLGVMQEEDDDLRVFPLIQLLDVVEATPIPTPIPPPPGSHGKHGAGAGGAAGPQRRKSLAVFKRMTSDLDEDTKNKDNDDTEMKDIVPSTSPKGSPRQTSAVFQPGIAVVQSVSQWDAESVGGDDDDDESYSLEPKSSFGARMMAALNEEFEKLNKFNAKNTGNNNKGMEGAALSANGRETLGGRAITPSTVGGGRLGGGGGATLGTHRAALGETGLYLEQGTGGAGGAGGAAGLGRPPVAPAMFMMHGQGLENRRGISTPQQNLSPRTSNNNFSAAKRGAPNSNNVNNNDAPPPQRMQRVKSIFGRPVMTEFELNSSSESSSEEEDSPSKRKPPSSKGVPITAAAAAAAAANNTAAGGKKNATPTAADSKIVSATARVMQTARRRLSSFGFDDDEAAPSPPKSSGGGPKNIAAAHRRVSANAQQLLVATSNANNKRRTSLFRGGGGDAAAPPPSMTAATKQNSGGDFFDDNLSDLDDDAEDILGFKAKGRRISETGAFAGAAPPAVLSRNSSDVSPGKNDLMPTRRRSVHDPFVAFQNSPGSSPQISPRNSNLQSQTNINKAQGSFGKVTNPLVGPGMAAVSPQHSASSSDPPTVARQTSFPKQQTNNNHKNTIKGKGNDGTDEDELELSSEGDDGPEDLLGSPQSGTPQNRPLGGGVISPRGGGPPPLPTLVTSPSPQQTPAGGRSQSPATGRGSPSPTPLRGRSNSMTKEPERYVSPPQAHHNGSGGALLRADSNGSNHRDAVSPAMGKKRQSVVGMKVAPPAGGAPTESYGAQLRRKQSVAMMQNAGTDDSHYGGGGGGLDRRKSVKDMLHNASNSAQQLQSQAGSNVPPSAIPTMQQKRGSIVGKGGLGGGGDGSSDPMRRANSAPAHRNSSCDSSDNDEDPALKPVNGNVKVRRLVEDLKQIRTTVATQLHSGGSHNNIDSNAAAYLKKTLESAKQKFVQDLGKIAPRITIDAFETKRVVTELFSELVKEGDVGRPGNVAVLSAMLASIVSTPAFDFAQIIFGKGLLRETLLEGFGLTFECLASCKPVRTNIGITEVKQWLQASMTANDRRCSSLLGIVRLSLHLSIFREHGHDLADLWQNTLERVVSLAQALPNEDRSDLPELLDAVVEHPFITFNLDTKENGNDKQTIFSRACREGDHELVQWMLLHRQLSLSEPNRVQSDGTNALQQAVARNHLTVVRMLLRPPPVMSSKGTIQLNGGGPDVFAVSLRHIVPGKGTALQLAKSLKRHEGIIEALDVAEKAIASTNAAAAAAGGGGAAQRAVSPFDPEEPNNGNGNNVPLGRGNKQRTKSLANLHRAVSPPTGAGGSVSPDTANAADASTVIKSLLGPLVTAQDQWLELEQHKAQLDTHDRNEFHSLGDSIKEMRLSLFHKLEKGLTPLRPAASPTHGGASPLVLWDPQAQTFVLRCCERIVTVYGDMYDGISDVKTLELLLRSFASSSATPGKIPFLAHILSFTSRPADSTVALPWVITAAAASSPQILYTLLSSTNAANEISENVNSSNSRFVPDPSLLLRGILDAMYSNHCTTSEVAAPVTVSQWHNNVSLSSRLNCLLVVMGLNSSTSSVSAPLAKSLKMVAYASNKAKIQSFWHQVLVDIAATMPIDDSALNAIQRELQAASSLTPTFRLDFLQKLLSMAGPLHLDVERDDVKPNPAIVNKLPYGAAQPPHSIASRAAVLGDKDLLRVLLASGTVLRHPNKVYPSLSSRTILTLAIQSGQVETVRVLVGAAKNGILDLNIETLEGRPLGIAMELVKKGSTTAKEMVEILKQAGAH